MSEEAMAGKQHRNASCVGLVDDLLVPNGTSGPVSYTHLTLPTILLV